MSTFHFLFFPVAFGRCSSHFKHLWIMWCVGVIICCRGLLLCCCSPSLFLSLSLSFCCFSFRISSSFSGWFFFIFCYAFVRMHSFFPFLRQEIELSKFLTFRLWNDRSVYARANIQQLWHKLLILCNVVVPLFWPTDVRQNLLILTSFCLFKWRYWRKTGFFSSQEKERNYEKYLRGLNVIFF